MTGPGRLDGRFAPTEHICGLELVAGELTQARVPREVRFVGEPPVTHADKVDKRALRGRYHHG